MRQGTIVMAGMVALAMSTSPAAAKDERAPQFQRLVDCKAIGEANQRLACYDREVAALDTAEKAKEVVVVDQKQIRQAKRSLFGLTLPRIDLFSGKNGEEIDQIEDKVSNARQTMEGWRVTLGDGSVWQQVDDRGLYKDPRAGDPAVVKRAALGSFVMTVGKIPAFKVRRVN